MTARPVTALLSCAVLLLAGCTRAADEPVEPQLLASPDYPRIVQDQGNSVPLPDGRTLWIFADTAQTGTRPTFFVTSSAAVAARGSLSLRYLTAPGGAPVEFLPRTPAERAGQVPGRSYVAVWPTGATTLPDGRVLISYAKYRTNFQPVDFDFLAGGLYVYDYPGAGNAITQGTRPAARLAELWTPGDGPVASPVRVGGTVYFTQCQDSRCYSLRAPAGRVADRTAYEWWAGAGWSADRTRRAAMSYGGDHPGQNPPTGYLRGTGVFVTVDTSHGIQSDGGLVWVAPNPWGPWSRPARFTLPGCTAGDGCYTLNPHPEDSPPGRLRVSYATAHDGPHVRVVDVPLRTTGSGTSLRVETAG